MATLDEFPDPDDIELTTTVNGERPTTLMPGDIVSSGTPAGVGHAEGRYLRSGDSVSVRVTGVGELSNAVSGSR